MFKDSEVGIRSDINPLSLTLLLKEVFASLVKYYNIDYIVKIPYDPVTLKLDFASGILVQKEEYDLVFKQNLGGSKFFKVEKNDLIVILGEDVKKRLFVFSYGEEVMDLKALEERRAKEVKENGSGNGVNNTEKGKISKYSEREGMINMNNGDNDKSNLALRNNGKENISNMIRSTEESSRSTTSKMKLSSKEIEELYKIKFMSIDDYE